MHAALLWPLLPGQLREGLGMPGSLSPAAPHPMAKVCTGSNQDVGRALGLEGGLLCQLIRSPEYNLFPNSEVFESNFIQVNKNGKWMDITHTPTIVTLAVTSSDPCLPLPDVLLMANQRGPLWRVQSGSPQLGQMDLTRLLPLRYVRLSVHSPSQRILRLQTETKTYFLQLHHEHPEVVFAPWIRLVNILQNGLSTTKNPAIPARHCLVSSRSSSTSIISPLVEHSDTVMRSRVIKNVGRKSATTQFYPILKPNLEKPQRVSFQTRQQSLGDTSGLCGNQKVLFYNLPPPLVCARCKGRLPRTELRKCPWTPSPSTQMWSWHPG